MGGENRRVSMRRTWKEMILPQNNQREGKWGRDESANGGRSMIPEGTLELVVRFGDTKQLCDRATVDARVAWRSCHCERLPRPLSSASFRYSKCVREFFVTM